MTTITQIEINRLLTNLAIAVEMVDVDMLMTPIAITSESVNTPPPKGLTITHK